jgi:hypothetical protein
MLNAKEAEGVVIRSCRAVPARLWVPTGCKIGLIDLEGSSEYDYFRRVPVFVIASVFN